MAYDDLLDYLQHEHGLSLRHWTRGVNRFVTGKKDGRGEITGSGATYEEAARELLEKLNELFTQELSHVG